jgi:hypothetical protein
MSLGEDRQLAFEGSQRNSRIACPQAQRLISVLTESFAGESGTVGGCPQLQLCFRTGVCRHDE